MVRLFKVTLRTNENEERSKKDPNAECPKLHNATLMEKVCWWRLVFNISSIYFINQLAQFSLTILTIASSLSLNAFPKPIIGSVVGMPKKARCTWEPMTEESFWPRINHKIYFGHKRSGNRAIWIHYILFIERQTQNLHLVLTKYMLKCNVYDATKHWSNLVETCVHESWTMRYNRRPDQWEVWYNWLLTKHYICWREKWWKI